MTTTYTANLHLSKPDFRSSGWADAMNDNWDAIDAAIRNALMDTVAWTNVTVFGIGQVVIDTVTGAFWIASVSHTSGAGTFAQDRIAHPTYWTAFSFGIRARGAWTNSTAYAVNDIAYDAVRGITGVCRLAHTSNVSGSIQDDAVDWDFIVNLPTVFTATATNYDNSITHLSATNVQAAIDAIFANVAGAYVSSNISYDHTISGMAASNAKTALDELKAITVSLAALIAANTTAITTGTIATGFLQWRPTAETLTGWIALNGLTIGSATSGASGRANADCADNYAWHWNNFSNTDCPVSTGRGANAAADFAANKTITVLDMKGTFGGLGIDTMGGAASTRLASVPVVSGVATTAGCVLGENLHTLLTAELASHTHINSLNESPHSHKTPNGLLSFNGGNVQASGSGWNANSNPPLDTATASTGISITNAAAGSGTAHNTVPRARGGTWYSKL